MTRWHYLIVMSALVVLLGAGGLLMAVLGALSGALLPWQFSAASAFAFLAGLLGLLWASDMRSLL